jgi:plastocyanin
MTMKSFRGAVRAVTFPLTISAMLVLSPGASRAETIEVKIDNFTFNPPRVTVKAGATVTWDNGDDIPHTVTATKRQFNSKVLDTEQKFSFTFTTPGVYEYFCALHPHLTGTIVVEAATGSVASP